ncbi:hypothetical protein [Pontibacter ummariensis]|uniref:hypothetical protein n=1 Tax=Pontibacter ummariensis TaxID=1610492 RepID=UPI001184B110|nr:hypothetical protein [Pontibacter ummariensis]
MKKCKACKNDLPLSDFYPCGSTVTPRCKPCHREEMKKRRSGEAWQAYYQKNRANILQACKRYYHKKKDNAQHSEEQRQALE